MGFPCDSAGKEPACNAGDLGSISGLGRSPGEGKRLPHSSILAWRSPRGHKELDTTEQLSLSFFTFSLPVGPHFSKRQDRPPCHPCLRLILDSLPLLPHSQSIGKGCRFCFLSITCCLATSHFLYQPPSCLSPHRPQSALLPRSDPGPPPFGPAVASHSAQSRNLGFQALPVGPSCLDFLFCLMFPSLLLPLCSSDTPRTLPLLLPELTPSVCRAHSFTTSGLTSGVVSSERPFLPLLTEAAPSSPWQSKVLRKEREVFPRPPL